MKLYVYQHNNVNKCKKRYQLIRWFGIFVHLLKDVLSNKQFLIPVFSTTLLNMKLYVYQQNSVNKSNKRYNLMSRFGLFLGLLKDV